MSDDNGHDKVVRRVYVGLARMDENMAVLLMPVDDIHSTNSQISLREKCRQNLRFSQNSPRLLSKLSSWEILGEIRQFSSLLSHYDVSFPIIFYTFSCFDFY